MRDIILGEEITANFGEPAKVASLAQVILKEQLSMDSMVRHSMLSHNNNGLEWCLGSLCSPFFMFHAQIFALLASPWPHDGYDLSLS